MQILPIYSNNYASVNSGYQSYRPSALTSFEGLTKKFKNKIYLDGQKDIVEILKQHPDTNPVVGQLPNFIFKKLPVENRPEAIREILQVFDDVAISIRNFDETKATSIDEIKNRRPKSVNSELTEVFRKYNIISKWDDDINVRYLDQGGKGKVFKIEGLCDYENEDEFVIKVFHQLEGKDWQPYKSHGCYAEINNGIYWRNHEGMDTHRGKFYFASMKSGYIVSKYLDEDVRLPKRVVPEYKYGIKCTDEEKDGPINGYNRIKGYNYDYGGMRVVNRIKNSDKIARKVQVKIKNLAPDDRPLYWEYIFNDKKNQESKKAGAALAIKYLDNKNEYIDKCLETNLPKVNQSLAYVLKYLPHKDAVHYFEKLMQTDDKVTQIILLNEIPLLSKRKDANIVIKDDINAALQEIIPTRVYTYYKIAEKYAMPETIEHLASFVHLLPQDKIFEQYVKLTDIDNYALQDRLIWKLSFLPNELRHYALIRLADKVKAPKLQERLLAAASTPKQRMELEYILNENNRLSSEF